MLVPQKVIFAMQWQPWKIMVSVIRILLWPIVSLYNEVRLDRVVHFGIQLPRFACIQAESNKNRIQTPGHAF